MVNCNSAILPDKTKEVVPGKLLYFSPNMFSIPRHDDELHSFIHSFLPLRLLISYSDWPLTQNQRSPWLGLQHCGYGPSAEQESTNTGSTGSCHLDVLFGSWFVHLHTALKERATCLFIILSKVPPSLFWVEKCILWMPDPIQWVSIAVNY